MIREQLYQYDDCVGDISPDISLYEHGVIRNSYTGETLLYDKDSEEIYERIIGLEEVSFALDNMDEDFFRTVGSPREHYISLTESKLSEIILSINEYSRFFI